MKNLMILLLFLGLFSAGFSQAHEEPDYYISKYEPIHLDFLRTNYFQINNGRLMQFDAIFKSYEWEKPYEFEERLKLLGLEVGQYNLVKITLEEKDDFHYVFPILLLKAKAGDLHELEALKPGEHIHLYGTFYKIRQADFGLDTDVIETIEKGGHVRKILLDARLPLTPTPTPTATFTPGPSLWQKLNNLINPKESTTPTGTVTPGAK